MKMHSIEVDIEVFEYLKAKAEPLVDTANSVLRRELLNKKNREVPVTPLPPKVPYSGFLPPIPAGTPKALEEILEVAYLVRYGGKSRPAATHYVAQKHGIAFQTVLDKYARQLGLTANQFDSLLGQDDLRELRALLRRKFNDHSSLIDSYLAKA